METKLSKILNKLVDNDTSLLNKINNASAIIKTLVSGVVENDPYIAKNSFNQIYSLSANIENKMDEKIEEYDNTVIDLSGSVSELENEIRNS